MTDKNLSTRDGFGKAMLELIEKNKQIIVLSADLTESLKLSEVASQYPEKLIQTGVAEQNMIGVAMGLAKLNKIPFASSFAVFNPGLNWSQIRLACYSNSNIKVIGGHAGLATGEDGATHQALEDIALMRVLPNMTVVVPTDYLEAYKATKALAEHDGPAYLRLYRPSAETITQLETPFKIGQAITLEPGSDVTIIACGFAVQPAIQASKALLKEKISCRVINLHTIKPIDEKIIAKAVKETQAIITVEDHQVAGGMGSAVLETLAKNNLKPKIKLMGVNDSFGQSGTNTELLAKYQLDKNAIMKVVKKILLDK